MSAAVFGLIGVVVGSVLGGGAQWLMARRDDRARAKTSARLIVLELTSYRNLFRQWHNLRLWRLDWWTPPSAWSEHSPFLARNLSAAQWEIVQQAYQKLTMVDESVKDLLALTPEARAHRNSQMDYGSEELARLSAIIQILSWAIEELGDVADYRVEEYTETEAEKLKDARSTITIWLRKEAAPGDEPTEAVLEAVELLISFARDKPNAFLDGPDLGTGCEFILRLGNQLAETWPDGGKALIEAASNGWRQASRVT